MTDKTSVADQRRQGIIAGPIGGQLVKLTIPMLWALIAIMSLGLVDSYFIAYLGTLPLAAIGFIIPITSIVQNLGLGMGMAVSSLTSKLIGSNNTATAARLITDGFYLGGLVAVIATVLLAWQMDTVFNWIGADDETLPYIHQYMDVWLWASPLIILTMISASTFRAIGDTKASAKITLSMTMSNIILDPLLIFGYGPIPEMGMHGAALATLISVALGCGIALRQLAIKERLLLWALPEWRTFKENLSKLTEIAIPSVLANAIVPITAAVLTTLVAVYGAHAVAGFGVGTRVEAVSLMLVYALSSTLPMFIGQNLGAKKPSRVYQASKIAFQFVMLVQLIMYALLLVFAGAIAEAFSQEAEVQSVIKAYLWLVPLSYGFSGVVILINVSMNVLGKPRLALYINLVRLFLIYLPLAYIGSQIYALNGLFIGIAVGNVAAFVLAIVLLKRTFVELNIGKV